MPPLDNSKHERFAQALAAGKTAVGAYEAAGYRRNRGHASTLPKNPKLLKRVDEILETRGQIQGRGTLAAIERVRLTKTAVMEMLLDDRELARKNGQSSAATCATRPSKAGATATRSRKTKPSARNSTPETPPFM
jgi:hypothetical protein